MDILYSQYGMAEQFDLMASTINKALSLDLSYDKCRKWLFRQEHYKLIMEVEESIKKYSGKRYTYIAK